MLKEIFNGVERKICKGIFFTFCINLLQVQSEHRPYGESLGECNLEHTSKLSVDNFSTIAFPAKNPEPRGPYGTIPIPNFLTIDKYSFFLSYGPWYTKILKISPYHFHLSKDCTLLQTSSRKTSKQEICRAKSKNALL